MEYIIKIHLERLPEGKYLATTDDIQGLVVQGDTIAGTLEIARDVARKLMEEQSRYLQVKPLPAALNFPDLPIVVEV